MKLEISHRKKIIRKKPTWILNHILLKSQWVIIEIKEEIRKHLKTNDNENTIIQNLWDTAKAVISEVYRSKSYFKRKKSLKKHNFMPKETIGKGKTKPEIRRRK